MSTLLTFLLSAVVVAVVYVLLRNFGSYGEPVGRSQNGQSATVLPSMEGTPGDGHTHGGHGH